MIFFVAINFIGCKIKEVNNDVEIVSIISNQIINQSFITPIYPNRNPTKKDIKAYEKIIEKFNSKKNIVAINLYFKPNINSKLNFGNCKNHIILNSKKSDRKIKVIDLKILKAKVVKFKDSMVSKKTKDFNGCDLLLEFSSIYFNKQKSKAFVFVSTSLGKLSGVSSTYYLEKIDGNWEIICIEGLSIS